MKRIRHLSARLFGTLRSRPLRPSEQLWVSELLPRELAALFFAQPGIDQRHAHDVARRVKSAGGVQMMIRAALLHDVGKATPRLGVPGRVLSTGFRMLRLPLRGRWRSYVDHGAIGADQLAALGAPDAVSLFARHHHNPTPPDGWPESEYSWRLLHEADNT